MWNPQHKSPNQQLTLPLFEKKQVSVYVKREDLIHPQVSGNKFRKLVYNIKEAKHLGHSQILTFGGAFSNHIAAVAAAGKLFGLQTIGMIRGEELSTKIHENPTLQFAQAQGMQLEFFSRTDYREKDQPYFQEQRYSTYGDIYILPEGGTNALAVKGCEEILQQEDQDFSHVCCAVGTGGTLAGIINSAQDHQQILGFSALKGDFLRTEIDKFANNQRYQLIDRFHFGGYAKVNQELINFINKFKASTAIPLDPIYTGKMFFGLLQMVQNDEFEAGSRILLVHTGGLQGILGMNRRLLKKNWPIIEL